MEAGPAGDVVGCGIVLATLEAAAAAAAAAAAEAIVLSAISTAFKGAVLRLSTVGEAVRIRWSMGLGDRPGAGEV